MSELFGGPFVGEHDPAFVGSKEPVRQGDVLQFTAEPSKLLGSHVWTEHLAVVITADCDLAHDKHGGVLSAVPVVPIHVYAANVTMPRVGEQLARSVDAEMREHVPRVALGWPTVDRMYELLREGASVDSVASFLPVGALRAQVEQLLGRAAACVAWETKCTTATSWEELLSLFAALLEGQRSKVAKRVNPGDLVKKELKNRLLKQLPGDALFLAAPASSLDGGHVAYLRIVREIRFDDIATSPVEERRRDTVHVRRIGRLSPVYRHRLTQQMAAVFTAIGLPHDYEEHRDALLDLLLDEWATSTAR